MADLFQQWTLPCPSELQSLTWCGDRLCDWCGGVVLIELDGRVHRPRFASYGPRFDAAIAADDGLHVIVYQRLGTKALLFCRNSGNGAHATSP